MIGRPRAGALGRVALDARHFPPASLDALFAAILVDDDIGADLRLPDGIEFDHPRDRLIDCFAISRRLWIEGFDPRALRALAAKIMRDRDLVPADRAAFKAVRAKFKHLRYAHALHGAVHAYPPLLDHVTITMGRVQDAYRNGHRGLALARGVHLRLLLASPSVAQLRAEGDRLVPTTPASFRALLEEDYAALGEMIARPTVTGHLFHATRKRVGRQVSFWDTLRTLEPTDTRFRMSRWLSAINGAMGAMHDDMIERRIADPASYAAPLVLPEGIRERIAALVAVASRR